jgi:hypothetical protein
MWTPLLPEGAPPLSAEVVASARSVRRGVDAFTVPPASSGAGPVRRLPAGGAGLVFGVPVTASHDIAALFR